MAIRQPVGMWCRRWVFVPLGVVLCCGAWALVQPTRVAAQGSAQASRSEASPREEASREVPEEEGDALQGPGASAAMDAGRAVARRLARQGERAMVEAALRSRAPEAVPALAHALRASLSPDALQELLSRPPTPLTVPHQEAYGRVMRYAPRQDGPGRVPYIVRLPVGYSPDKAWPVFVSLHGGGQSSARRMCQANWRREPRERGVILVCPSVPHGLWWTLEGEERALAVLADLPRWLNIDPTRISLEGSSSGGAGAWRFGIKYPWLWRGLVVRSSARPRELEALSNVRRVPVFLMHGFYDGIILVWQAQESRDRLRALGADVRYVEDHKRGHQFLYEHNSAVLDWLAPMRRPATPERFVYQTVEGGPAPGRVYWVRPWWRRPLSAGWRLEGERVCREVLDEGVHCTISLEIVSPTGGLCGVRGVDANAVVEGGGGGSLSSKGEGAGAASEVARGGRCDHPLEGVTVLLPSSPQDTEVTAEVRLSGQVVYTGAVTPSLEVALESWRDHRDPTRVTTRGVRLVWPGVHDAHTAR